MCSTFHFLSTKLLLCLLLSLFHHHFTFATNSKPTGLSLRAIPDDSPGSPLYGFGNLTIYERVEKLIKISYARANYSISVLNPNAGVVPNGFLLPTIRDAFVYAVSFTIGSRLHPVKLLMDTGGSLTWTQCQPCINCFRQTTPIYDSRASRSYGPLPCSHQLCRAGIYSCVNGRCVYDIHYLGGASTRGVASWETFQFYVDRRTRRNFINIPFGCSYDSTNVSFQNTSVSGIFGLSLSLDSMTSQLSQSNRPRFSYCFVPFNDGMPNPIIFRFGDNVPLLPPRLAQTTPFVTRTGYPFFYLNLLDISVANHRLGLSPSTFRFRPGGGGCIVDSGALFTVIDSGAPAVNAYLAVINRFAAYYEARHLRRLIAPPPPALDLGLGLCYQCPPRYNDFASITFHFSGANYFVDGRYGHFIGPNFFCIAILQGSQTMLGAWHMQNKRLIYDAAMGGGLQFADERCANDHIL